MRLRLANFLALLQLLYQIVEGVFLDLGFVSVSSSFTYFSLTHFLDVIIHKNVIY